MKNPALELTVTMEEMVFLAALSGSTEIFGFDYPFEDEGGEAMDKAWAKVKKSLTEKAYIKEENGQIVIDKVLAFLMRSCCHCDSVLNISQTKPEGKKREQFIYTTEQVTVEMIPNPTDARCKLRVFLCYDDVAENILEQIKPEGVYDYDEKALRMKPESFQRLRGLSEEEEPEGLVEELLRNKFSSEDAQKFATCFRCPSQIYSLIRVDFRERPGEATGFVIYEHEDSLWKIANLGKKENRGEQMVNVGLKTAKGMEKDTRQWLQ